MITGAGSGIGRALAVEVASRGSLVAISDVDEAGLAETVELVKAAGAPEVRADRLDVSDRAAFATYAAAVREQFGRVNVVVNNAGVTMTGDFEEISYDDFEWIMGINFWGVVTGTKEFLPHLIESGDGHVVNISSLFGLISTPGQSTYNASKYAVRGFTEALREEMLIAGHPVGRHLRAPRRHQDRHLAQRPQDRQPGRRGAGPALREEAGPDGARAGRADHRGRDPQGQGPAAGRHRRAPDPPRVQAGSGRATRTSSRATASASFRRRSRPAAVRMGPCSPGPLSRSR